MLPPERPQFSGSGVQTRGMRQHFMNAIAGFHVAYPGAIVIEHKKPKRRRKIAALLTLRIDGVNKSRQGHKSLAGNFFEPLPELILQAHASFVALKND